MNSRLNARLKAASDCVGRVRVRTFPGLPRKTVSLVSVREIQIAKLVGRTLFIC